MIYAFLSFRHNVNKSKALGVPTRSYRSFPRDAEIGYDLSDYQWFMRCTLAGVDVSPPPEHVSRAHLRRKDAV